EKLGLTVSLPTEAQWEYACRAGTTSAYSFGSSLNGREANCDGNYPYGTSTKGPYLEKTVPVKSYAPNAWGLYDMHGNVWEWCQDWYDEDYYTESPTSDPTGPNSGSFRVRRGGSWYDDAEDCRSAYRRCFVPGFRNNVLGFRIVLADPAPGK
ncbi:MAG: formylglycine-generating enzyme family protein, partial [Thermoguttaceae bacterium]|nr:formylglycine-generating enzyme family protein [Thermoguttaceae bacterium]